MDVNIGYAWGQWMRARRTAAEHPDEAVRARAREKLASWERVMTGMQAGTVEVGSRTATGAPAWVTPEVIHGGFATGQHVAGGPLLECERAIATRLGMVAEGRFREDLFYRLDVFGIRVPALRERKGDLASLVSALVGELSRRLQIEPPPVTRAILARLESHDWPGNVRELANVLETASSSALGARWSCRRTSCSGRAARPRRRGRLASRAPCATRSRRRSGPRAASSTGPTGPRRGSASSPARCRAR